MRVLITGIDGFVGSHTAAFLAGIPGIELHGTLIPSRGGRSVVKLPPGVRLHTVDVVDAAGVRAVIASVRPDRIVHLAAQAFVPASVNDPLGTFTTNIMGGVAVLEAVRLMKQGGEAGPEVLVVSTSEVYGRVPPERQPITEEHPLRPANPYAASKASIDLIAQEYRKTLGVRAIIARPFNHAGPGQSPLFVCSDFARQFASIALGRSTGEIHTGDLEARRDFLDVRDVVRAYWALFDARSEEFVFNVCSGSTVKIGEILALLGEISGIAVRTVSEGKRLRAYDLPVFTGNCDRLKKATGWAPAIPLRDTLRDVFTYWRSELASIA